ncbi:MAG: hypothetical protein KIS81_11665 [Maricaulaceae bacterium]|nr:hypothetical protein [Maricaulaceae bacterium]
MRDIAGRVEGWIRGFLRGAIDGHGNAVKGSVTSKYIHSLDTALVMAADTIAGYIQGLLDGKAFKQTAYALDRDSRKAALARYLEKRLKRAKLNAVKPLVPHRPAPNPSQLGSSLLRYG